MSKELLDVLLDSTALPIEAIQKLKLIQDGVWEINGISKKHGDFYERLLNLSMLTSFCYKYGVMEGKREERAKTKERNRKAQAKKDQEYAEQDTEIMVLRWLISNHVKNVQKVEWLAGILDIAKAIDEAGEKEKASAGVGARTGAQDKYQLS